MSKNMRHSIVFTLAAVFITGVIGIALLLALVFIRNFHSLTRREIESKTRAIIDHMKAGISGLFDRHAGLLSHAAAGIAGYAAREGGKVTNMLITNTLQHYLYDNSGLKRGVYEVKVPFESYCYLNSHGIGNIAVHYPGYARILNADIHRFGKPGTACRAASRHYSGAV
ncbi:MAG: hypothetical protein LBD44_03090 [Spirochaetaceae bacterium]|jgi:hypothetical protein|nr:hypothetical protein [Spirochaetaceae bacterium]